MGSEQTYFPSSLYRINEGGSIPGALTQPASTSEGVPINVRERQIKNVPEPAIHKPSDAQLYVTDSDGRRKANHAFLKDHFFREGRLTDEQALWILEEARQLLASEHNLVHVQSPVTICGDIHGQYYDLMKLFEVGGNMTDNEYLFLGDYVDRGCFSIECLLYLYTLKLWYPTKITLLRGNHECRHLTEYFTFQRECLHKYSPRVYEACIQSFCALPLAALVDGRFFCIHGGLSPELHALSDLENLDRFREPGSNGLLCDLLWSDPVQNYGHEQESGRILPAGTEYIPNEIRGCSFFFTYEATCRFLERNNLLGVIRGHEAQDAGYTMHRKTPTKKFPSVITIFSAPNYLDVYHNRGAVIKYANKNITIRQYNSSIHPYWLPNFMDAFTWSLPFVGAKITEMLLAILRTCSEEELEETPSDGSDDDDTRTIADLALTPSEIAQRRQQIKNKILAVGRMQRVFQLLREEAEAASELTTDLGPPSVAPGGARIRPDALDVQGNKIRRNIRNFADARRSDMANERLPEFEPHTPTSEFPLIPVPSMRSEGATNMEALIRRTLEDDEGDTGVVERLADRIARGRRVTGRPRALKRHETA